MKKVIGLVGLKQSGKSTTLEVADKLYGANEVMLAGRLKDACAKAFNIPRSHFDDQKHKEEPFRLLGRPSGLLIDGMFIAATIIAAVSFIAACVVPDSNDMSDFFWTFTFTIMNMIFAANVVFVDVKAITEDNLKTILEVFELDVESNLPKIRHHIGKSLTTPREAAQYIGTDVLRDCIDPDIHIKTAIGSMKDDVLNVVSDIRFGNELAYFINNVPGFKSFFILRESVVPKDLSTMHASESGVLKLGKKCDYKILNNGTKEEYSKNVEVLLKDAVESASNKVEVA